MDTKLWVWVLASVSATGLCLAMAIGGIKVNAATMACATDPAVVTSVQLPPSCQKLNQ